MANTITPIVAALLACVCQQLATDGHPACDCCQVVSSGLPPMSGCDGASAAGQGRAWARFTGAEWTEREVAKCPVGAWTVGFQVGVYRCKTSHDGACVTSTADAQLAADDIASLTTAVLCCPILEGKKWVVREAEIVGPEGNCFGATVTLEVQLMSLVSP